LNELLKIAGASLVALIFSAGGFYFGVRRMRKDLNGVGGRQRKMDRNFVLILMVICNKREDRELIATLMKE
jgi:hypothetical protein